MRGERKMGREKRRERLQAIRLGELDF